MKKKPSDFKRPKRKLGHKSKRENATNTKIISKKIHMQEQSVVAEKGQFVTSKKQNLNDLVVKSRHYTGLVRKEAMAGLVEMMNLHPKIVSNSVRIVLMALLERMVDKEKMVRVATLAAWKVFIKNHCITPFMQLVVMTFCSAMTHVEGRLRHGVLPFMQALVEIDVGNFVIPGNEDLLSKLIENFGFLLNAKSNVVSSASLNYDGNDTVANSVKFRLEALNILNGIVKAAHGVGNGQFKIVQRMVNVRQGCLLLYPSDTTGERKEHFQINWESVGNSLLQALYDLWIECYARLENAGQLPPDQVASIIVGLELVLVQNQAQSSQKKLRRNILRQLNQVFPIGFASTITDNTMTVWGTTNARIAHLLATRLPNTTKSEKCDLPEDATVTSIVQYAEEYMLQYDYENDQNASNVVATLFLVLNKIMSKPRYMDDVVGVLDRLRANLTSSLTNTNLRKQFNAFIVEHVQSQVNNTCLPKHVLQWAISIASNISLYLENDDTRIEASLVCILKVLQRSSTGHPFLEDFHNAVLHAMESLFNGTNIVKLAKLSIVAQNTALSIVHYLTTTTKVLLKGVAKCVRDSRLSTRFREALVYTVHQRGSSLKVEEYLSFLLTIVLTLDETQTNFYAGHISVCSHVCRFIATCSDTNVAKLILPSLDAYLKKSSTFSAFKAHSMALLLQSLVRSKIIKQVTQPQLQNIAVSVANALQTAMGNMEVVNLYICVLAEHYALFEATMQQLMIQTEQTEIMSVNLTLLQILVRKKELHANLKLSASRIKDYLVVLQRSCNSSAILPTVQQIELDLRLFGYSELG